MSESNSLGIELLNTYNAVNNIVSSINITQYKFMDKNDFKELTELNEIQYIYWNEIIQRTHFCSITSLQRVYKWMNAMNDSLNCGNYYSFCASLRGVIEACSDSFFTISKIITPLAENFSLIEDALNFKAKISLLTEEIEDELIHYMYGRKLTQEERVTNPVTHKVLLVTQYLTSLNDNNLDELYNKLCQVTHPSMMSLMPFTYSDEDYEFILHNEDNDTSLNKRIMDEYNSTIHLTINSAVLLSMGLLKLINKLNVEAMKSLKIDECLLKYIENSDLWNELELKMTTSSTKMI